MTRTNPHPNQPELWDSEQDTAPETDAPTCPSCGTLMQRAGSCHACPCCGTTSGCS